MIECSIYNLTIIIFLANVYLRGIPGNCKVFLAVVAFPAHPESNRYLMEVQYVVKGTVQLNSIIVIVTRKLRFGPLASLCQILLSRNVSCMEVVKIFTCLDLEPNT